MDIAALLIGLGAGLLLGGLAVWLISRQRASFLSEQLKGAQSDLAEAGQQQETQAGMLSDMKAEKARLEATLEGERKTAQEKLEVLTRATEELKNAFKALSADALKSNSQSFIDLAKTVLGSFQKEAKGDLDQRKQAVEDLVTPVKESLEKVTHEIQEMEKTRQRAYGSLEEHVKSMLATEEKLRTETGNLVKALRSPIVRGQWGEIQLRKVVEIAGMVNYCDFTEQETVTTEEGRLRPDLIIRLPGGKNVVVDAKAPLQAYLDALDEEDEEAREALMKDHARLIRDHMGKLSTKAYWDQFEQTPEFVFMFLPGEHFYSEALKQDPGLIESGVHQRVFLANPTTLITLLRAVAYGWSQEKIAESAQEISRLGRDIYDRLCTLGDHFARAGKGLDQAVKAYNDAVGSLESRVLPQARRFIDLGVRSNKALQELTPVDTAARQVQAPEMLDGKPPEETLPDGSES
jgi:DNA recombination protein RmuC